MSKYTRIACTIAGRYPDGEKGGDGFYLDGRLKQGHISEIDITLDREDQGAFYAVYASAEGGRELGSEPVKRNVLDRIMNDMKNEPNRNIDEEINELADAAVTVAGRLTLDDDDSKQPYFSGLMVKDAEIAAVTLGRACAFLYRQDILYPLTEDDIALEPVDTDGNPVPNFNIYKAGSAATIRYSNIAQLQGDDCFILCNKEVLQCVNQRELLQILFEVEEASEAAERVVQLCAERLPERPCQFMIGFVEDILADSKTLRSMGRRQDAQVKDSTGTVPVLSSITGRQNFSAANLPEESNFEQRFEEDLEEGRSGHKGLLITLLILLVLIAAYVVGDYYYNITDRVKNQLFPTTTTTTEATTTEATTTTAPTTTEATTTRPTTTRPTEPPAKRYTIQAGDTLYTIVVAQYAEYNLSDEQIDEMVKEIIRANPDVITGENGENYSAGDEIKLPAPKFN